MGLAVHITIKGDKETLARIKKLGTSMKELKPAMDKVGEYATGYYASIGILDKGRPYNAQWPDYSTAYKKWKEIHYPGRPMMVQTGTLSDSFKHEATKNSVRIYNTAPYFKYHQSDEPHIKIPRRQMMGINGTIKRVVREAIRAEIKNKIDGVL